MRQEERKTGRVGQEAGCPAEKTSVGPPAKPSL